MQNKDTNNKRTVRNNRGKGRRKEGFTRSEGKDFEIKNTKGSEELDSRERDNDPNWYFLSKEIASQASSFSFDSYVGVPTTLEFEGRNSSEVKPVDVKYNAPAIMSIRLAPSPGNTETIRSGINMASLKTYTYLSSLNAKTTNYAPQDVSMLILSIGEVISILEHVRRAFGVAFTYNQRNRSMPTGLLEAMGFDANDFLTNIADHRLEFNSLITEVNKLPILSNVSYLFKCADLYQKVYVDSTSTMGQLILMRPGRTWRLNETALPTGSILEDIALPDKGTWSQWVKILDSMINALFTSSTFNYIYSDIQNISAKQGAKLLFLDYLLEGYAVVPEYNRNFLLQVHNLQMAGAPLTTSDFQRGSMPTTHTSGNTVQADPERNSLKYNPLFNDTTGSYITTPFIDMDVPEASVEDRIEATRFTAITKRWATSDSKTPFAREAVSLPDHYVLTLSISNGHEDNGYGTMFGNQVLNSTETLGESSYALKLTQYDWAPIFYVVDNTSLEVNIIGDLNYWTTLNQAWFERVNDLTFQALFELR